MRKRLCVLAALMAFSNNALAQSTPELKTDQEKMSYAIGLQIGQSLVRQGVSIEPEAFTLAIQDVLDNRMPRLSPEELQAAVEHQQKEVEKHRKVLADKNLKAGRQFLQQNKKKEGVTELASGLQYKILERGSGDKPSASDTVVVHYRGTLIDGREFDNSHRRGEPATLTLDGVIKGWQEALPLMSEGDKWQLFVPADLAYGELGAGAVIGPNEALVFEVELVAIK